MSRLSKYFITEDGEIVLEVYTSWGDYLIVTEDKKKHVLNIIKQWVESEIKKL